MSCTVGRVRETISVTMSNFVIIFSTINSLFLEVVGTKELGMQESCE
jgi:hypothetical protein